MEAAPTLPQKSTNGRIRDLRVPGWFRAGFQLTSWVSTPLASAWAAKLFFTPPRTRPRPDEQAVLDRGERFGLDVNGRRVHGWSWGEGPTVLLVHGWGGQSGQMTGFVSALVNAGLRAITFDFPAHGESEGKRTSLVDFSDTVFQVAARFGPVHAVVAHSFGAAGTTLALSRGLVIERAVYVAPPSDFQTFWARFRKGVGVSNEVWGHMWERAERRLRVEVNRVTPLALATDMRVPLLVVHDQEDGEVPHREGEEVSRKWPRAELVTTSGLGHVRILKAETVVEQTVRFLSVTR